MTPGKIVKALSQALMVMVLGAPAASILAAKSLPSSAPAAAKTLSEPVRARPAAKTLPAESKHSRGWLLTQYSQAAGDYKIWLTNTSARFENTRNDYGLLVIGPDLYEFNRRKKLYRHALPQQWKPLSVGEFLLSDGNFTNLHLKESREEPGLGTTLQHQILEPAAVFHGAPQTKSEKLTVVRAEFWIAGAMPCPKSAFAVAERLYDLPDCAGFPVRLEYVNRKGKHHKELETSAAEKVTVNADSLRIPDDYKQVYAQKEIYVNPQGDNTLKDMLLE